MNKHIFAQLSPQRSSYDGSKFNFPVTVRRRKRKQDEDEVAADVPAPAAAAQPETREEVKEERGVKDEQPKTKKVKPVIRIVKPIWM